MSPLLADSSEPRATIVTLSFSLRTVKVGPVNGCLPKRVPVQARMPIRTPTTTTPRAPPVTIFRRGLQWLARGRREEVGTSDVLSRCGSPLEVGEELRPGLVCSSGALPVGGVSGLIDPYSSVIQR